MYRCGRAQRHHTDKAVPCALRTILCNQPMHVQSKVLGRVDGEAWVPDKSLNQGLDNRAESAYRIPTPPHESGCSGGTWLPVWARDCHVGGRQWPRTLQFDSQRPHVSQSRASCLKHATRRRPEEMAEQCASTDGQTDKQRHTHTHLFAIALLCSLHRGCNEAS